MEHRGVNALIKVFVDWNLGSLPGKGAVGKLHAKEEAAGKVRLFAMADAPTQWVLYPLHEFIMEQLRAIQQDGTFNQTRPLDFLVGSKELYSYDLTAATDRLPITLQVRILGVLFGGKFAEAWSTLLVGRTYGFFQFGYSKYAGNYKYATGQPMGAYSSWAMLALTHHFLVQVSAWKAEVTSRGNWFTEYAVLGDDLVIADGAVAEQYLILLKELGMPVNLHKSLVSKDGSAMEFAKRTIWNGKDISPVPLAELSAASGLAPAMASFAVKYSLNLPQLLAAVGMGWRNISWLSKPLNKLPSQIRTLVLTLAMPKTQEELPAFFELGSKRGAKVAVDLLELSESFKTESVSKLVAKVSKRYDEAASVEKAKDSTLETLKNNFWPSFYEVLVKSNSISAFDVAVRGDTFILVPSEEDIRFKGADLFKQSISPRVVTGLGMFFFILYHLLYGRYVSDYASVLRLVLQDLRGLMGRIDIMANSQNLVQRKLLVEKGLALHGESYGFFQRYWDVLLAMEELASASPAVLEFEKPGGLEGLSLDYSKVTPVHLRYYRLWSGVVQGASPILNLGVKPTKIIPNGLVPSEALGLEEARV